LIILRFDALGGFGLLPCGQETTEPSAHFVGATVLSAAPDLSEIEVVVIRLALLVHRLSPYSTGSLDRESVSGLFLARQEMASRVFQDRFAVLTP
jgi:hypothetical protein